MSTVVACIVVVYCVSVSLSVSHEHLVSKLTHNELISNRASFCLQVKSR